jgi:hypothetical protein
MPAQRYVILHHKLADGEHWDLMLERGQVLATWQLSTPPVDPAARPVQANRIGDHRKEYLDYEGPVSGDRGEVVRFDAGEYRAIECQPDRWVVELNGTVLKGPFLLTPDPDRRPDGWTLERA